MFERLLKRKEMTEPLFSLFRSLWREANFSQLDIGGLVRLSGPAAALISSISSLKRIEARNCPGVDDAALALWAQSLSPTLAHLDVSSCRKVSDKGIAAVVQGASSLRELIASDLPLLTDASCRVLASSPIAGTLEVLDWSRTRLTDKGIAEFVTVIYPEEVDNHDDILLLGDPEEQEDDVANDNEDESGNEDDNVLDDCPERDFIGASEEDCTYESRMPALVSLRIAGNPRITEASARSLIEGFPSLRTIDVSATLISVGSFGSIVARMENRFPNLRNKHLGPGCQFSMPSSSLLLLGAALPVRSRSNWNSLLFSNFLSDYGWQRPGYKEAPPKQPPLAASSSTHRVYATITAYLTDSKEQGKQSMPIDAGEQEAQDDEEDRIVPVKTRRVRKPVNFDISSIGSLLDDSASDGDDDDDLQTVKEILKTNPTKRLRSS